MSAVTNEMIDLYRKAAASHNPYSADTIRAGLEAALYSLPESGEAVAWLPADEAPRGVSAIIKHRSGQIDYAYKTDNGEPFLETWRYAGTAKRGEQAPWPDSYLPVADFLRGLASPVPDQGEVDRLRDARQKQIDATDHYNERLRLVMAERERGNWSMKVDDEYRAMSDAQSEFIRVAQDVADAARAALEGRTDA